MATIYEVAKLAGVSPATVSRVFSGSAAVSTARAEAVRRAADELRFTPDRAARALRTRSTDVIGLVIPDIENPYFTEVARGVEDRAQEAGFSVVLCNSDGRVDKELDYLRVAVAERMAGVIIAAAAPESDLSAVVDSGRPVVAIDRMTRHAVDSVVMANREAGALAATRLIGSGRRRIACITGPESIDTARHRAEGWRAALKDAGLVADPELLIHSTFGVDGGRDAMERLLALPEQPDAVVAANNLLGVGVLQVLSERGMSPARRGVAVVGSLPYTTISPSAVLVVRLPAREMGAEAARMLLERLDGVESEPRSVVLEPHIEGTHPAPA